MKTLRFSHLAFLAGLMSTIIFSSCSMTSVTTDEDFEMVELPDGSIAYLNHNSSLKFENDFDPREVRAEGELFFSVAKGESPFTVKTPTGEVVVLGTEFSVVATAEDLEIEVEEGIVELNAKQFKANLKRGQHGVHHEGDKAIKTIKAEFKYQIWMKDLKIAFKKVGREFRQNSKAMGKESKKSGKKFKKGLKSLK